MTDTSPDLLDLLEELAQADTTTRPDVTVHADPVRGHIGFLVDGHPTRFIITDDGTQHLNIWSGQGARLDTTTALELGQALTAWAQLRSAGATRRANEGMTTV